MNFYILGPLEVLDEDRRRVALGGIRQRAVLALLLIHANEPISTERLIDELWGERPPAKAAKAIQVHISRLRKALTRSLDSDRAALVLTRDHGYELMTDRERVDAARFERLLVQGRRDLLARRAERCAFALEEALALWRSEPLADFAHERFAQPEIARLNGLRVGAEEDLIEAKLALARHTEVVGPLEQLIAEHPYRERLRGQLMLALYRCERQAEALQAYQDARRTLVGELGLEPGERLRELERSILAQDPALALPAVELRLDASGPLGAITVGETDLGTAAGRTTPLDTAQTVVGRESELAAVDALLAGTREGVRLLMIDGDDGMGKTTLWREAVARAAERGYRVLSCRPGQGETRLSFAGLGDLLAPLGADAFSQLPGPQRRALDVALLRVDDDGSAPDPRAIGTGLVSLVAGLAADGPLLLALDNVQWLDRPTARAVEFMLRRLGTSRVAVLVTLRSGAPIGPIGILAAVPAKFIRRLHLGPLSLDALYEILKEQLGSALTHPLLGRINQAARGNPFYALELVHALEVEGRSASLDALPVPEDVRELLARRLRRLPQRTRDELLKASALADPNVSLVDRAELVAAEEAGVVSVRADGRIEFTHPLFGGAVYAGASRERRRRLHAELAELVSDLEERARHLSRATDTPDERVAAVLERAADLAHRRGAPEVAAELEERAAQCTPADALPVKLERWLCAARHHLKAGDRPRARALGEEVVAASDSHPARAQALYLVAETWSLEKLDATIPLLEEALACVGDDTRLAAQLETSLALISIAMAAPTADVHLDRALELAELGEDKGLLAEVIALRTLSRLASGHGLDEGALEEALALEDPKRTVPFQLCPSLNVALAYEYVGRLDQARALLIGLRERIRVRGEESDLAFVLVHLAATAWLAGDLEDAEAEADDALRVASLTGEELFRAFALTARAVARATRGETDRSRADAAEALDISEQIGWAHGTRQARWAQALLALSEGDPRAALGALEPVIASVEALGVYEWPIAMSIPEAIEALAATGELDRAGRLTDALAEWGRRFDRPWALALSGRCRALHLAARGDLPRAQAAAERALVEHDRLPMPLELARTLMVLGQLQHRRGKRRAARESLQRALGLFEQLGAPRWAEKARAEASRIEDREAPSEQTENERLVAKL